MADEINLGGKLYICATAQPSDLLVAGFEALTFVEISQVQTMPDVSEEASFVSQTYVNQGRARFKKGIVSGVATEVVLGHDYADAGQDALHTASKTRDVFAFKREYTDSPNSGTTTNTVVYFRALIGPRQRAGGGVEDYVNYSYALQITDQEPIEVEPEAI